MYANPRFIYVSIGPNRKLRTLREIHVIQPLLGSLWTLPRILCKLQHLNMSMFNEQISYESKKLRRFFIKHNLCLRSSLHILIVPHQALINILFNYLFFEALSIFFLNDRWRTCFGHSMILSQLGKIERASTTSVHWCAQEVTTDLQGELKVWDVFHIEIKLSISRWVVRICWGHVFFLTTSITSNLIINIHSLGNTKQK